MLHVCTSQLKIHPGQHKLLRSTLFSICFMNITCETAITCATLQDFLQIMQILV